MRSAPSWTEIPLFKGLRDEDLQVIAARLQTRPMKAGDVLIQQGVWTGVLFIVKEGIVEVSMELDEGGMRRAEALRRLVAGDCVGEMSLITGALPAATARALTDGETWVMRQEDLMDLWPLHPEIARNMSALLSERLLYTGRQQFVSDQAETIVLVTPFRRLATRLAEGVTFSTNRSTLLVDAMRDGEGTNATTLPLTEFAERRDGTAEGGQNGFVAARVDVENSEWGSTVATLERLGTRFRYVLVALSPNGAPPSSVLVAYATKVLFAAAPGDFQDIRKQLAEWPDAAREKLRGVVVDAPPTMVPTPAMLDRLSTDLGATVEDIIPVESDGAGKAVDEAIQILARRVVGRRIGVAFGAGGSKGWAHLGVLRAFERHGVPIDVVAGSSVGAFAGATVAMKAPLSWLEDLLRDTQKQLRPTLPLFGVIGNRKLAKWAEAKSEGRQIEDLPVPYAAVAVDLVEAREIIMRRGPLWQAVLASSAIPGVFPAVRVGRHWLVDGGVVSPVPVEAARLLGADIVIGV